jgi:hypothetical protein
MKTALIIIASVFVVSICCLTSFFVVGNLLRSVDTTDYLSICLDEAYESYVDDWNQTCKTNGLSNNCELPILLADNCDRRYQQEQNNCYSLYR